MKIRLDKAQGIAPGNAIEVEADKRTPSGCACVTIWNDETHTSIALTAEQARQVASALIAAFGGGSDAG